MVNLRKLTVASSVASFPSVYVFAASGFAPHDSYLGTIGFPARCWATSLGVLKFNRSEENFLVVNRLHLLTMADVQAFLSF